MRKLIHSEFQKKTNPRLNGAYIPRNAQLTAKFEQINAFPLTTVHSFTEPHFRMIAAHKKLRECFKNHRNHLVTDKDALSIS